MASVIGIDLGGTDLRAAVVDLGGHVLAHRHCPTDNPGGPEAVIAQMLTLVAALRQDVPDEPIIGVGIGAPGPLDPKSGIVLSPPNLMGWHDVPLRERLSSALNLPAALDNDGHAAVLGEWRFGAGRGLDNVAYITISTGIGGGIIADGHLLQGRRGLAGHVGHIVIDPEGPLCTCGNHGCWEVMASGTALGKLARRAASTEQGGAIRAAAQGEEITARHVVAAARSGDALATELVLAEGRLLGIGLTSLIHLVAPDRIIVGGGLSAAFDLLIGPIEAEIAARVMPAFLPIGVVKAELGTHAGVIGAAALAMPMAGGMVV